MGTFCFDNYAHPSLWCDEKKRLVERRNAEESMKLWKRKKAEELFRHEQEKKEYHEMVLNHCPWGRPGGGAPNLDVRMRNITSEGLHPTPKYGTHSSLLPPCRFNVPGGGAEIRSAADRVYITLKDHPSMTFRNRGQLDIEFRYKGKPEMVDKIVVSEKTQTKENKKKKKSDNHVRCHDPWGRAGPGGAPWRNPKKVGSSFMHSMGWTNKELMKELDQENPQTASSVEKTIKPMRKSISPLRQCCPLCSCKCTLVSTSSTEPQKQPSPIKKSETQPQDQNKKVQIGGCHEKMYSLEKDNINKPAVKQQKSQSKKNSKNRNCLISGGVELVPLLARRRGTHRPISLSSTDVTKQSDSNRWTQDDIEYLNDLTRQMAQKRRRHKILKDQEIDLCKEHFETFESFWGRPGHGAPRPIKTKLKLDDLLYGFPVE